MAGRRSARGFVRRGGRASLGLGSRPCLQRPLGWTPSASMALASRSARVLHAMVELLTYTPLPSASTPFGRRGAYRAAKQTSRPDGKQRRNPKRSCVRTIGRRWIRHMRLLKLRGISGRVTALGLSVRPLAALGYHTATFGPLPGTPEGRRTQKHDDPARTPRAELVRCSVRLTRPVLFNTPFRTASLRALAPTWSTQAWTHANVWLESAL